MAKKRPQKQKNPAVAVEISTVKRPAAVASVQDRHLTWRFSLMDMTGPWPCGALSAQIALKVRQQLASYEKKTWEESQGSGSAGTLKKISIGELPTPAKQRLERLKLDDFGDVWELRLGGKPRVWGLRHDDVCYLLWWDPDHSVFPAAKR